MNLVAVVDARNRVRGNSEQPRRLLLFSICLALQAASWLAEAADSFDVVADLQARGGRTVVARARTGEISCASLSGLWFGVSANGRDLWVVDPLLGTRLNMTSDTISEFAGEIQKWLAKTNDSVAKAKAETKFPADSRVLLSKYTDPLGTGVTVAPIKMKILPNSGATTVPLAQTMNERLAALREEVRRHVLGAELLTQELICSYEFTALPATAMSEDSSIRVPIFAVPASKAAVGPRESRRATGSDLMRLFRKELQ
jgi:hypothetical protein